MVLFYRRPKESVCLAGPTRGPIDRVDVEMALAAKRSRQSADSDDQVLMLRILQALAGEIILGVVHVDARGNTFPF